MKRRLVTGLLVLCLSVTAASAQPVVGPERDAIDTVIRAQIDAFRRDDAAAAFGYASPAIQAEFGTAENFISLVRQHYAPVYHPRDVNFGDLALQDGALVQHVFLTAPDGTRSVALYTMEHEPDGSWRIAGCRLEHGEDIYS